MFDGKNLLSALLITWLYDEFETLYILSSYGMSVNSDGELAEADRQELIRYRNDWPTDFDGSAHLSIDGKNIPPDWPKNLDAELINGRLRITFLLKLPTAVRPDFGTMEFQPHTTVKSKPNTSRRGANRISSGLCCLDCCPLHLFF